jgi:hypothetical protein
VIELLLSAVEYKWGNGVRQTQIHTAEPLMPELSAFVAEIAIEKLRVINLQLMVRYLQN